MAISKAYNYTTGEAIQVFSSNVFSTILAANTEQHFTVPSFSQMGMSTSGTQSEVVAQFSFSTASSSLAAVWVANNQTAAVPSSSFASSGSQLNPIKLKVKINDVLSFISTNTAVQVSVVLSQG